MADIPHLLKNLRASLITNKTITLPEIIIIIVEWAYVKNGGMFSSDAWTNCTTARVSEKTWT